MSSTTHRNFHSELLALTVRVFSCVFLLVYPLSDLARGQATPLSSRFALLIGVGKYAHLSEHEQLSGSSNDVEAMRQLLIERFGFKKEQIVMLTGEQANSRKIRAAMSSLVASVSALPESGPPAQVVVHFSGHGSQIADQAAGPDRDESDGLDETWVPYDATRQGGDQDIRDDEINKLAAAICRGGKARLLMISDCCHSGTGARGSTTIRKLRRDLTAAKSAAVPNSPVTEKVLPAGAVFLSACRAREQEPEFQDDDKTYGLLTRFLVETLSQERKISGLTYDLLQKAIVARYRQNPRVLQPYPAPQLEGDNDVLLKSPILGFGPDVDREAYYRAERASSKSRVLLRAGKFHQVTVGSLFELYDRADQIDSALSLTWLKVTQVSGTTSLATVFRWKDAERTESVTDSLPTTFQSGYAILRHRQPSDLTLRLKVVQATGPETDSPPLAVGDPRLKGIAGDLTGARKSDETQWMQWISDKDQPCDLILRIDGDYARLFPATGVAQIAAAVGATREAVPATLRGGWGPIDVRNGKDKSDPPQTLTDYLRRITRARNLISLAQDGTNRGASDYNVELELHRVVWDDDNQQIRSSTVLQPDKDGGLRMNGMTEDSFYGMRVVNNAPDGKPVYVTVLEIGPNMGIQRVIPLDERSRRLAPGEKSAIQPLQWATPHGTYQAVVLVTREPADFSFVAQLELPNLRGNQRAAGGAGTLQDQLAEFTHFRPPANRGRPVRRKKTADTTWQVQVVSWTTSP